MLKLSKRSVSAFLRSGDRSLRVAAAAASASRSTDVSSGGTESRWYSSLINGHRNVSSSPLNLKPNWFISYRNESTAAVSYSDASSQTPPPAEKFDVSRLMNLTVNSLYSNKEVFLPELISNASDALDKLRYLSVTQPELSKNAGNLDICIYTDEENYLLRMTRQEFVDCLGTIAQSGTAKFLKALKDSEDAGGDNNLIGQFGVGFYSAFLVADRVTVSNKSPKYNKQNVWEGEADSSSYTIKEVTDPQLIMHLKRDDKGFADPERIQKLVKNLLAVCFFPHIHLAGIGYTKEAEFDDDPTEAKKYDMDDQTEPKQVTTEEDNEFYRKAYVTAICVLQASRSLSTAFKKPDLPWAVANKSRCFFRHSLPSSRCFSTRAPPEARSSSTKIFYPPAIRSIPPPPPSCWDKFLKLVSKIWIALVGLFFRFWRKVGEKLLDTATTVSAAEP